MQWPRWVVLNFQHMKKYFFILWMIPVVSMAQKKHTVGPKESLFSIARQFNVHPRELAEYNHISFEKGLTIGQVIKIPNKTTMAPLAKLSDTKADTKVTVVAQETAPPPNTPSTTETNAQPVTAVLSPIFHTVQKKETLYQISQKYNKVPIADLKSWNHLTQDGVKEGMKLIVGYANATKPLVKEQTPALDSIRSASNHAAANNVAVAMPSKKTEPAPVETKNAAVKNMQPGGYFASGYLGTASAINETGTAGVFKSTSGWDDKKYYCLYNNATAGTIVKITHTDNQKTIYAKVLDMMPDLKQNKDILIRISNAAAQELGAITDSFNVSIQR